MNPNRLTLSLALTVLSISLSARALAQTSDAFVARMMAFDVNHDGKLTRAEITDERLLSVFNRADVNRDGVVTKAELLAFYQKESATQGGNFPPNGGPPGGRGGPGMRPRPGQIMPEMMQQMLNLTPAQKKSIAELQKDVDARLDKILTPAQKAQMEEMKNRGPGLPGGPGGPPDRD